MKRFAPHAGVFVNRWTISILLSTVFISFLIWRVNLGEAWDTLRGVETRWLVFTAGALTLMELVMGDRWRRTLSQPRSRLHPIVTLYIMSRLVNVVLPLRGGDVARTQLGATHLNISRSEVAGSIFGVETPINWLTSLSLLLVGLGFLGGLSLSPAILLGFIALGVLSVVIVVAGAKPRDRGHIESYRAMRILPGTWRERIATVLANFSLGMRTLRDARAVTSIVAVTYLGWGVQAMAFWGFGQAFDLDLNWPAYVILTFAPNMVRLLPAAPGDIGTWEVVVTELAIVLGAEAGSAAAFAVGSHLAILAWTGVLGTIATYSLGLTIEDIKGAK